MAEEQRGRGGRARRSATAKAVALGALLALALTGTAGAAGSRDVLLIDSYSGSGLGDTRTVSASSRDLHTIGFDDKTSALLIRGDIAVAAYSEIGYGGRCETFVGDDVDLGDNPIGTDAISSVKIGHTCGGYVGGEPVVRDLAIARGDSPASATCPAGYDRKPANLNEGTENGRDLFLCVRWTGRTAGTILPHGLRVSTAPTDSDAKDCTSPKDDGEITERVLGVGGVGGDLNEGAETTSIRRFIYLCTLSHAATDSLLSGLLLRDVDFIVRDSKIDFADVDDRCRDRMGPLADGSPHDLNETVGGKYIYVCWTTDLAVPFATPDTTAPTIELESIDPPAGPTGWRSGHVTVTWACSDTESGVVRERVSWQLGQDDGEDQKATGTCTDEVGNRVSEDVLIDVDATAPTITEVSRVPAANAAGWHDGAVTVTWSCADATSGAEQATVTKTLSVEGADQTATGTCKDHAGNEASATASDIDIDLTDPVVTWSGVAASYGLLDTVAVGCTATDALSGVAATTCSPISRAAWTFAAGDTTLTGSATDRAGNTSSATATIRLVPTAGDLCELTRRFAAGSKASSAASTVRELCRKLSVAATTTNAGQRASMLAAYADQVRSNTPKLFTAAQAGTLTRFAGAL